MAAVTLGRLSVGPSISQTLQLRHCEIRTERNVREEMVRDMIM